MYTINSFPTPELLRYAFNMQAWPRFRTSYSAVGEGALAAANRTMNPLGRVLIGLLHWGGVSSVAL